MKFDLFDSDSSVLVAEGCVCVCVCVCVCCFEAAAD